MSRLKLQTVIMARAAFRFVTDITSRGGQVRFMGTKDQPPAAEAGAQASGYVSPLR